MVRGRSDLMSELASGTRAAKFKRTLQTAVAVSCTVNASLNCGIQSTAFKLFGKKLADFALQTAALPPMYIRSTGAMLKPPFVACKPRTRHVSAIAFLRLSSSPRSAEATAPFKACFAARNCSQNKNQFTHIYSLQNEWWDYC